MILRPVVKYYQIVWLHHHKVLWPTKVAITNMFYRLWSEITGRSRCARAGALWGAARAVFQTHFDMMTCAHRAREEERGSWGAEEEQCRPLHSQLLLQSSLPLSTDSTVRHGAPPVHPEQLSRRAERGSRWSCSARSLLRWVPDQSGLSENNGLLQFILCQCCGHKAVEHYIVSITISSLIKLIGGYLH